MDPDTLLRDARLFLMAHCVRRGDAHPGDEEQLAARGLNVFVTNALDDAPEEREEALLAVRKFLVDQDHTSADGHRGGWARRLVADIDVWKEAR